MARKPILLDATGRAIEDALLRIGDALGAGDRQISFKRLQQLIREDSIDDYLAIGDEIHVEKETSASIAVQTTGTLSATFNEETWLGAVESVHHGVYEFVYDGSAWNQAELGDGLLLSSYGITTSGTAVEGDIITITVSALTLVFQYVAKDKMEMVNPALTHSAVLLLKNIYANYQFSASEAIIYADTAMPAGTYHFNLYKASDIYYLNAGLQNKDVQFTLGSDVPQGGQIVVSTGDFRNSTQVSDLKLTSYGADRTTVIESNIACSEGTSGTDLGSANTPANSNKINSTDRTLYGSNKWSECALRLWLNSDKLGNAWWSGQGRFDRKPTNASMVANAGWMHGIERDFLAVLQPVKNTQVLNWFDGGTAQTVSDLFFPPSNNQVWFTDANPPTEGEPWDYFKVFSDNDTASTGADSNRIKLNGSTPYYWWLRSPYPGHSSRECIVDPTGGRDNSGAYDSVGVCPACVIA